MDELYDIPDMNDIPGLRFRPFEGMPDAEGLLAVRLERAARDKIDPLSTMESIPTLGQLTNELSGAYAQHLAGDAIISIIAEIDGLIAGYGRVYDWHEGDGTHVWLTLGWVRPEWCGRGLGTAMLHWMERQIRAAEAKHSCRWEFAGNAGSTEIEATALLRDNGYRPGYTMLEMELDWAAFAPETRLPDGVEVRPSLRNKAHHIAASVEEAYRDEYEGGRYSERFDAATYAAELTDSGYDPSLWRVAWVGDQAVGQVIPIIERGRAEIEEVSVRPAWRRRGLARALLSMALLELQSRGVEVVRLHTMAEFPTQAHHLYHSLGFRTLKEFPRYRKPA